MSPPLLHLFQALKFQPTEQPKARQTPCCILANTCNNFEKKRRKENALANTSNIFEKFFFFVNKTFLAFYFSNETSVDP